MMASGGTDYGRNAAKFRPKNLDGVEIERARLWIDAATMFLAAVDLVAVPIEDDEGREATLRVVHGFSGFNEDHLVVPPAFELMHFNE
jgi:hypothetical protein